MTLTLLLNVYCPYVMPVFKVLLLKLLFIYFQPPDILIDEAMLREYEKELESAALGGPLPDDADDDL